MSSPVRVYGLGRTLEDVLGPVDQPSHRERRLPQLGLAPVPPAAEPSAVLAALEAAFPHDVCGLASGSIVRLVGLRATDNAAAFALTDRLLAASGRRGPSRPADADAGDGDGNGEAAHLIARLTPPAIVGVLRPGGRFTAREERLFEAVTALAGSGLPASA